VNKKEVHFCVTPNGAWATMFQQVTVWIGITVCVNVASFINLPDTVTSGKVKVFHLIFNQFHLLLFHTVTEWKS
jgi:hypothetical protein